jgi:membrane-associated phospholipid phosphatase
VRMPRRGSTPDDGWTSEVSSGFALAGFLALVFVGLTALSMGPLSRFDTYFNLAPPPPSWLPVLHVIDRVGQRAVCLPILAVATYVACRRNRSWRPGLLVAVSVFALNLLVLALKLALGRDTPQSADPSFFTGGMAYPSGHSSNVVLVYGLVGYLLIRYAAPGRWLRGFLWALVPVLSLLMVFTSMTLHWHWFTDLVSGLLVGGVVLQLTASVDQALPATDLAGWREGLRVVLAAVRPGRSHGPTGRV